MRVCFRTYIYQKRLGTALNKLNEKKGISGKGRLTDSTIDKLQNYYGPDILPLDIYDAVAHFNIGCQASVKVFEELGISPGHYCKMRLNELIKSVF